MKKIKSTWYLLIVMITSASCSDYLEVDKYFNDMLTIDTVFSKKKYTEQWLWNTYSHYNNNAEIANKGTTSFSFASDECIFSDWDGLCEKYQNVQYSASDQLREDRWWDLYKGIRKASIFILNVDRCHELLANEKEDYRAQARFLRAYFYWMLIKQYGPVPIMPEEGVNLSEEYEAFALPRTPYDSCVSYISQEMLQASRVLPLTRPTSRLGQPTRGAALGARAKVLLYAASPLFNGNKDLFSLRNLDGTQLISQEYKEEKWALAAAAAKEVIDLQQYELFTVPRDTILSIKLPENVSKADYPYGAGNIDPFESYRQCFNGEILAGANTELIMSRRGYAYDPNDICLHASPKSLYGWNCIAATQKQVDAYYMCDGYDIEKSPNYEYDENSFTKKANEVPMLPANVCKMYAWREPRFYASIGYNGSIWENLSTTKSEYMNKQIFYYKGTTDGKDAVNPSFYLWTGTSVKKFYNPADSWAEGGKRKYKTEPTMRYADVLLWYAEALNELTPGKQYKFLSFDNQREIIIERNTDQIRYGFSRVRFRAGLPDIDQTVYDNQSEFRQVLKRERQIEFFIESSRYFDLRRWKDAEVEEAKPLTGLNVDMSNSTSERTRFHVRKVVPMRKVFLSKMYLWPIPKGELDRNAKLVQNPGWE